VSNADNYEVYYQTGSLSITRLTTVTGTSYNHTGLTPNTAYNYYVTAKNSSGTSDYSSRATVTTPLNDAGGTKPAAPTGVTASAVSSSSIRVTWNPVPGAASYDVHYAVGSSSAAMNFAANTTSTPYTHTGLQSNTTYYYFIKAKNSAGDSAFSSAASAKTPAVIEVSKPGAPTGVTAVLDSTSSIRVSWNPVSGATGYEVYFEIGSSATKNFAGSVTDSPFTHTGLQPNTTYYYYIKATNSAGESAYSSAASAKTPAVVEVSKPGAPTGVTAVLESTSSIRVSWNPVSGATGYEVYFEIGSSTTKNFAGSVAASPFTHTGLQPDTTYYYYIKAINSAGESNFSSFASLKIPAETGSSQLTAPTGVTAATISSSSIRVTWNPVSGATSYDIYYEIGSSTTKNFARSVTSPPYTHTGLQPSTIYSYYIIAKNSIGQSGFSSSASSTTGEPTVPAAPTGVTATGLRTTVTVTWNAVPGATSYKVYYGDANSTNLNHSTTVTTNTYRDTDSKNPRSKYYYQVAAINSYGEGSRSSMVLAVW
jgi:fibronectin type 3 domain-containing protein